MSFRLYYLPSRYFYYDYACFSSSLLCFPWCHILCRRRRLMPNIIYFSPPFIYFMPCSSRYATPMLLFRAAACHLSSFQFYITAIYHWLFERHRLSFCRLLTLIYLYLIISIRCSDIFISIRWFSFASRRSFILLPCLPLIFSYAMLSLCCFIRSRYFACHDSLAPGYARYAISLFHFFVISLLFAMPLFAIYYFMPPLFSPLKLIICLCYAFFFSALCWYACCAALLLAHIIAFTAAAIMPPRQRRCRLRRYDAR